MASHGPRQRHSPKSRGPSLGHLLTRQREMLRSQVSTTGLLSRVLYPEPCGNGVTLQELSHIHLAQAPGRGAGQPRL